MSNKNQKLKILKDFTSNMRKRGMAWFGYFNHNNSNIDLNTQNLNSSNLPLNCYYFRINTI